MKPVYEQKYDNHKTKRNKCKQNTTIENSKCEIRKKCKKQYKTKTNNIQNAKTTKRNQTHSKCKSTDDDHHAKHDLAHAVT